MLTFDAVTTYAPKHWENHARRCVESFEHHWGGMTLLQFTDQALELSSTWLSSFKIRHAARPTHNYRFDAVRFAHKVAAIELAYKLGTAEVLVWIDADCVTHASVDSEWLTGLLGDGEFGYLRRARKYPECGFMLMRRCPAMDEFIGCLVQAYRSDAIFHMAEWHDSWVIDQIRQQMNLKCVSLSGDAESSGHPLVNGPLGSRLDHLKGQRKTIGRSLPTDLVRPRNETYWSRNG